MGRPLAADRVRDASIVDLRSAPRSPLPRQRVLDPLRRLSPTPKGRRPATFGPPKTRTRENHSGDAASLTGCSHTAPLAYRVGLALGEGGSTIRITSAMGVAGAVVCPEQE